MPRFIGDVYVVMKILSIGRAAYDYLVFGVLPLLFYTHDGHDVAATSEIDLLAPSPSFYALASSMAGDYSVSLVTMGYILYFMLSLADNQAEAEMKRRRFWKSC